MNRFCRPIMTKPKPKAAKPAAPEVSSPSSDQSHGAENFGDLNKDASENTPGTEVPLASEEPMETEKPESAA